ncbi:alpha/beta-hydrolase [Thozetella sp. PMI_491]|nr:alpha/beta-hydrolase [Thozetella sp. PMI_491]
MWKLLPLAATLAATACVPHGSPPIVQVKNGTYRGAYSPEYDQDHFLGIPYAQPPVGDLRFQQAQSLNATWAGVKDVTSFSPECVGYGKDQTIFDVSEDCLTLNVVRPKGYENDSLPIGFWIHGGGFVNGGNADQRYNLSFIVQQSVKVGKPIMAVAINYRLSAWGFLAGDQVTGEGLTNMGLRDQRLALHWVQENIASFGGDPKKVTIWGESAGAASVGFQCLRKVPYTTLNNIINSTLSGGFAPVIDGDFVRTYSSIQVANGQFVRVPLLIGANSDEGTTSTPTGINTTADFRAALDSGRLIPEAFKDLIADAYPHDPSVELVASLGDTIMGPPYGAQWRRLVSYISDQIFIAPRRRVAEKWAEYGVPVYAYRFNAIPALVPAYVGVGHFKEIAFVFHNFLGVGYWPDATNTLLGRPQSYFDLSDLMASSWVSFIHDLDPNTYASRPSNVEPWPRYDLNDPKDFLFDANVTSHAESDSWRAKGIKLINDNAVGIYRR